MATAKTVAKATPEPAGRGGAEGTGTVHRTIRLIAAIASERGDVGVGQLSEKLTLPIPTIHRMLHLLRGEGVVEWDKTSHRYRVGPELYRIAAQVGSRTSLKDIARDEIAALSQETGETLLFALYQPSSVAMSFEVREEGDHPLQYRIQMHEPLSLVWGASGKAILAYLPDDVVVEALSQERENARNGSAPPSRDELEADLMRCREAGFCVSEGEKLAGARGVAAPVFGPNGVVGCICMTSPKERIPISRVPEFGRKVTEAATRISHSLGASTRS